MYGFVVPGGCAATQNMCDAYRAQMAIDGPHGAQGDMRHIKYTFLYDWVVARVAQTICSICCMGSPLVRGELIANYEFNGATLAFP